MASETPTATGLLAQIAGLTAPAADRASFARLVVVFRRVLGLQERLAADLQTSDFHDATSVTALLNAAGVQQARLAETLGASACRI